MRILSRDFYPDLSVFGTARRNLSLKEARFKMLTERLVQVKSIAGMETMLRKNEG